MPGDGPGTTGADAVPVCYRHPARPTAVRCSRCERPVCPDCMRSAAVGFQCPSCVAEGSRSVRQARTTFGGRIPASPGRVTAVLVGVNVLVFVAGLAGGADQLRLDYGNVAGPATFVPGGEIVGVAAGEYYRLLTAAFLHAGLLHLGLNMVSLLALGPAVEELLGRGRFLALYLLSAAGGSVAAFLLAPGNTLGVGASGAVFGLFGAHYVIDRRLGREGPVLGLLAVNLVITFAVPFIDWRAHLGGLAVGALVTAALAYAPRRRRTAFQATACAGIGVLLAALVAARVEALTGLLPG